MRKFTYGMFIVFVLVISNITFAYSFYGPTMPNDHLYRIAMRVRPAPDVIVQQVMIALLEKNPRAFSHHNVNGLKAGYQLAIPSYAEIIKIHRQLAIETIGHHNQAWAMPEKMNRLVTANTIHKPTKKIVKKAHKVSAIEDQIPSIEEPLVRKKLEKSSRSSEKTSVLEIASMQQNSNHNNQTDATSTTISAANTANNQQTAELNEKLNTFMQETKQFQQGTNTQLTSLQQQNQALNVKLNQLTDELRTVTYRFIQASAKNKSNMDEVHQVIDNVKSHSIGLSTGILSVVLLTYLLIRTFKPKTSAGGGDQFDYLSNEESIQSKLNLARAYIDMGDDSGAKKILKEVLMRGNQEQKKEAKELLGTLTEKT